MHLPGCQVVFAWTLQLYCGVSVLHVRWYYRPVMHAMVSAFVRWMASRRQSNGRLAETFLALNLFNYAVRAKPVLSLPGGSSHFAKK